MTFTQIITDLKKEIEKLLKSLDGYGFSREENIKELKERNCDKSGIEEDIMNKYWELKAKLDQTLLCEKIANSQQPNGDLLNVGEDRAPPCSRPAISDTNRLDHNSELSSADALIQEKQKHKEFVEKINELIDNKLKKVENMTCSDVLKQNMKWNLEELKAELESELNQTKIKDDGSSAYYAEGENKRIAELESSEEKQ